jgi:DNA-binding response OmpR family regulator
MRALVVEDEPELAALIQRGLIEDGISLTSQEAEASRRASGGAQIAHPAPTPTNALT